MASPGAWWACRGSRPLRRPEPGGPAAGLWGSELKSEVWGGSGLEGSEPVSPEEEWRRKVKAEVRSAAPAAWADGRGRSRAGSGAEPLQAEPSV